MPPDSPTTRAAPRLPVALAVATLLGVLLGLLGPFGSYLNGDVAIRLGYWIVNCWTGLLIYGLAATAAERIAPIPSWRGWTALAAAAALASVPQTIVTRLLAFILWPDLAGRGLGWLNWYVQVLTIGAVAVFGYAALRRFWPAPARPAHDPAPVPPARAELALNDRVLALQMEDHYVRVHGASGSELLLMPLAQAIALLPDVEGERTHRSWWVARGAIARIEGSPRGMRAHLTNGVVAPVARTAVARLRSAGWLDADRGSP